MGQYVRRPSATNYYGNAITHGSGSNRLGDNSDSTSIEMGNSYYNFFYGNVPAGGSTMDYPTFTSALIPASKKIVAIKAAHRFRHQDNDYSNPPSSWLRNASNSRMSGSELYSPDGYSGTIRNQVGPAVYKPGNVEWTAAEISGMTTELTIRNVSDDAIEAYESWQVIVYDEPLPAAPALTYPAAGATVATSSVSFTAAGVAPQSEQLIRGVFQVATNSGFTTGVKTFYGGYHGNTAGGSLVSYNSNFADASFTDLAPGTYYARVKLQDVIGTETGWGTTTQFTITHAALPVPTNISPAPGSTQTTPYGIRTARNTAVPSDNRYVGMEWQFSQSATFASGIVTWKNLQEKINTVNNITYDSLPVAGTAVGANGHYVAPTDPSQYLIQGTWYMRSRTVDKYNQTSAWSTVDSFVVSHPPLAQNITPTSYAVIDQTVTPVRWTFGDPYNGDSQTAYQIKVYNDANTLVYDSGKLGSVGTPNTALQHFLAINVSYLYSNMRYTITLWDKDNATRTDIENNYFVFSNSPAITMAYPAVNEVVLTGQPTFQWNPGINRPGTTQKTYELKVYNLGTGDLIYTSGVVTNATARNHTPPQVILRNLNNYQLTLRIVDSDGLTSTLTRNFSATYNPPPEPTYTVDDETMQSLGYVLVDWTGTVADNYFIAWKIYRREVGTNEWQLIETINDSSVHQYHDWLVPSVGNYQYTVTQLADRSGFILESPINDNAPESFLYSEDYWFIDPDDETKNVRLYNVTGDDFTEALETNSYHVKGRGMRVNFGDKLGMNGTLNAQIRPRSDVTTRQQRANVAAIQRERGWCYMRDPFGNITKIAILDIGVTRIPGVGLDEFVDLTIPYQEVF